MLENVQYPEWQRHLRDAQAKQHAAREADETKRAEAERQRKKNLEATLGQHLARALGMLGIEVETPAVNEIVLPGGYIIWISGEVREGHTIYRNDSTIYTTFTLNVKRLACGPVERFGWDAQYAKARRDFQMKDGKITSSHLATFAEMLDEVDYIAQNLLDGHLHAIDQREAEERHWAEREARYNADATAEPSTAEQLVDLIRRIVREEREAHLDF